MVLELGLLLSLYVDCGNAVNPELLHAIVRTESSQKPYVIANVTNGESYSFNTHDEAVRKVNDLSKKGHKYSVGLMQIYSENFERFGINAENAFETCKNIDVGSRILKNCYERSVAEYDFSNKDEHVKNALSCYYSGNFKRGFAVDEGMNTSYVERVLNNHSKIFTISLNEYKDKMDFKGGFKINLKEEKVDGNEDKQVSNALNKEVFNVEKNYKWDILQDY